MPYAPFHLSFPDIADTETRMIITKGNPELPDDTYLLSEAYCDEEDCDCRRVFFNVISEKDNEVGAVLTYGWETKQYYRDWMGSDDPSAIDGLKGIGLNLSNKQADWALALSKLVDQILKTDRAYLNRIKRHYRMFRAKIDEHYNSEPIVVDKIPGRNDICNCGSGKKYKKCCIA